MKRFKLLSVKQIIEPTKKLDVPVATQHSFDVDEADESHAIREKVDQLYPEKHTKLLLSIDKESRIGYLYKSVEIPEQAISTIIRLCGESPLSALWDAREAMQKFYAPEFNKN